MIRPTTFRVSCSIEERQARRAQSPVCAWQEQSNPVFLNGNHGNLPPLYRDVPSLAVPEEVIQDLIVAPRKIRCAHTFFNHSSEIEI
jgi:hypothetical protein